MAAVNSVWNPRYLAYCNAHGLRDQPERMLEVDREKYPGGSMYGFTRWLGERWSEFLKGIGMPNSDFSRYVHSTFFDAWLADKFGPNSSNAPAQKGVIENLHNNALTSDQRDGLRALIDAARLRLEAGNTLRGLADERILAALRDLKLVEAPGHSVQES